MQTRRKGTRAPRSLARRARTTKPARYPKNTTSKLSATYKIDFVAPQRFRLPKTRRLPTKLPGIGCPATAQSRCKASSADQCSPETTNTTPKKKKKTRKKKCHMYSLRHGTLSQEPDILRQKIQKVSGGRYVSVCGSLKLGESKIRITVRDGTSGTSYKKCFQLDEDSVQTAQANKEQADRMLRVVVLASDLVPSRGAGGCKKAWEVEIDPEQINAALEAHHEMDERDDQQQPSQPPCTTTRRTIVGRNHPARERMQHCDLQQEKEDEFAYFNESSCPVVKRPKKKLPVKWHRERLPHGIDIEMDAPPFLPKTDDIVFRCIKKLDHRDMSITVAYRPLDGSLTAQAHDKTIEHYWRLALRTRPPDTDPGEDDGFNNLTLEDQLGGLEILAKGLEIVDTSAYSLGKLDIPLFVE